jgi:hypothetical protein
MVDLCTSVLQGLGRFPQEGDPLWGITTQPGRNFEGVSIAEYTAYIPELVDLLHRVVDTAFRHVGDDEASDGWLDMMSADECPPDPREAGLWGGLGDAEVLRSGPCSSSPAGLKF